MWASKVFRDTVEGSKILGTRGVPETQPNRRAELIENDVGGDAPIKHKEKKLCFKIYRNIDAILYCLRPL